MHPSKAIREGRSQLLRGRKIVLGISGSIAAIEVPRIARELIRHGAEVRAVMSREAARLVTPESVAFATGHPPVLELSGDVEHVTLLGLGTDRADLLLIAPATANTISKIAHGIDDTPVTSCASVALGGGVPILLAPAMHAHMGANPAIRENLERLRSWGVGVIAAVGEENEEKLASPEEIAAAVLHRLGRPPWSGRSVIVIGGAAREPIDSVRSVTNESSGATAVALATQAYFRGAATELWAAAIEVPVPRFLSVHRWRSVSDLRSLARKRASALASASAVLVPAALSDFTLPSSAGKISSRDHPTLTLDLTRAPKVLPELRRRAPAPCRLVGFKLIAEQDEAVLEAESRRLLAEADLDWVVANDRSAMGSATTRLLVVTRRGELRRLAGTKFDVAGKLLDDLGRELADLVATPASAPRRTGAPARRRRRARAGRA
ncbi:MAG: bifunctional phosphopantothenoylcysteine decarboxylase/phosphopantothenate--cysteine ligase CoaBC [Thermoplasmata archaeon]|nr:bifunctional phosphopantothenoylcysteine decarboxylase/phosphopantothenate--cysteine ligase CoaBC [Thermoplasmata archaeon]